MTIFSYINIYSLFFNHLKLFYSPTLCIPKSEAPSELRINLVVYSEMNMVMPIFAYRKPVFFMTLLAVEPIMFLLKLSFLFSVFLHIFFHHLKFLAVYAGYRHAHATYVHDEMTVAVNTNDIALDAGKNA